MLNASKLATAMLEWEVAQRENDALKAKIEAAVHALAKTQTVGNVTCKFRRGNTSRDWEGSGKVADPEIIEKHSTTIPAVYTPEHTKTDWKKVCVDAKIEATITSVGENTATLQLLD